MVDSSVLIDIEVRENVKQQRREYFHAPTGKVLAWIAHAELARNPKAEELLARRLVMGQRA